jgi:hypothetical protein
MSSVPFLTLLHVYISLTCIKVACPDGRIVQIGVLNDEFSDPDFQYHVFLQKGSFCSLS